jgi:hypothetical protein
LIQTYIPHKTINSIIFRYSMYYTGVELGKIKVLILTGDYYSI